MDNIEEVYYTIALTRVKGIGPVTGKKIIEHFGSAKAVYEQASQVKFGFAGQKRQLFEALANKEGLKEADRELAFCKKYNVAPIIQTDSNFPSGLLQCEDAPLVMYYKGNEELNSKRMLSIIGTRKPSVYGKQHCQRLIEGLADVNLAVVSGLAYGIDVCAHKEAMKNNLPTIGVLGHGLDTIYPAAHRQIAGQMVNKGGLLTEYVHQTKPDKENFPRRNRVVAGMSEAVLVIEAGRKSGTLITAELANSYNREVMALPGRVGDKNSEGCNYLIKSNKAVLVEQVEDVLNQLNWEIEVSQKVEKLPEKEVSPKEKRLLAALDKKDQLHFDELAHCTGLPAGELSTLLLTLEFDSRVVSMPGNYYAVNR